MAEIAGMIYVDLHYRWHNTIDGVVSAQLPVFNDRDNAPFTFSVGRVNFTLIVEAPRTWSGEAARVSMSAQDTAHAKIVRGELRANVADASRQREVMVHVSPGTNIYNSVVAITDMPPPSSSSITHINEGCKLHGVTLEAGTKFGRRVRAVDATIMRSRHNRLNREDYIWLSDDVSIGAESVVGANIGENTTVGTNVNVQQRVGGNIILPDNYTVTDPIADAASKTEMDHETLELFGMFQHMEEEN